MDTKCLFNKSVFPLITPLIIHFLHIYIVEITVAMALARGRIYSCVHNDLSRFMNKHYYGVVLSCQ